jgi:hypothetical protein
MCVDAVGIPHGVILDDCLLYIYVFDLVYQIHVCITVI